MKKTYKFYFDFASYISISKSGNFFQIFVAFSEYLHFICNLFVQKEIEIFERMEFILWWKTLWYSLLTIVECSTNFLERKNAPARQWQSVINPAGQQLRCDAQWADIWNFVRKPSQSSILIFGAFFLCGSSNCDIWCGELILVKPNCSC